MNTHQEELQSWITRKRLPDTEMKKYWAAYMNLARLNFFKTLMFISNSIGDLKPAKDNNGKGNTEVNMHNMGILTALLGPEDEEKARLLIFKHFPFLRTFCIEKELSLSKQRTILIDMACIIGRYRNMYSHSIFISDDNEKVLESEKRCSEYLQSILTVSTRIIKERYRSNKNDAQRGMIDDKSLKFISENKVKFVYDENGKRITAPNKKYYLSTIDKDNTHLSYFGKLMLTCILLEKKYATDFLTQCHFLDAFNDSEVAPKLSERRLMLEVMTALRIRLAEKKLSNEKSEVQISLDILNELKKCPFELYELLGSEDKRLFTIVADTGETILLRRHEDRFPQLALSWIDSSKAFDHLRFQVNAGKLRYLFRDNKHCIDGQTRMRVLEEPLNGYRRLMEFEEERIQKQSGEIRSLWPGLDILNKDETPRNDASVLPYISDYRVRYLFDGDNIGISIGDFTPSITKTDETKYRVTGKTADCCLSKYELLGLLFYHLLTLRHGDNKRSTKNAEDIIIDAIKRYKRLFSDVKEGILKPIKEENANQLGNRIWNSYGINIKDIPDKIIDYLLVRECNEDEKFTAWKNGFISEMLQSTKNRIKRFEKDSEAVISSDNKPGKKNHVSLKPGAYASFIANDIVFFQECGATEKMTGLNFKVMQSRLATFTKDGSTSFNILLQTLKNAHLVSTTYGKGDHPFLYRVIKQQPSDIVQFYKIYLNEKVLYLQSDIPDNAIFLHGERKRWENRNEQYYRDLAERYLQRPIQLPRQLFESHIRQLLLSDCIKGERGNDLKEAINSAASQGRCNTTYMIMEYFADYLCDGTQFFYGLFDGDLSHEYNYRFYSLISNNIENSKKLVLTLKKGNNSKESPFISALERGIHWSKMNPLMKKGLKNDSSEGDFVHAAKRAYKEMTETERMFRRYAVQDEVLFLAAKITIRRALGLSEQYNCLLGDIKPQGGSLLEQTIPSITTKHTINTGNKKQKPKQVQILQKNVKLKDFGKVFKLLNDRRIFDLLFNKGNEAVSMTDLCEELERYDRHSVDVFDSVLKYESKITKGYTNKELMNESGQIDFKAIQAFDKQNTTADKEDLRLIRNAFSHNQYPQYNNEPILFDKDIPEIADEISIIAKDIEENTK